MKMDQNPYGPNSKQIKSKGIKIVQNLYFAPVCPPLWP